MNCGFVAAKLSAPPASGPVGQSVGCVGDLGWPAAPEVTRVARRGGGRQSGWSERGGGGDAAHGLGQVRQLCAWFKIRLSFKLKKMVIFFTPFLLQYFLAQMCTVTNDRLTDTTLYRLSFDVVSYYAFLFAGELPIKLDVLHDLASYGLFLPKSFSSLLHALL